MDSELPPVVAPPAPLADLPPADGPSDPAPAEEPAQTEAQADVVMAEPEPAAAAPEPEPEAQPEPEPEPQPAPEPEPKPEEAPKATPKPPASEKKPPASAKKPTPKKPTPKPAAAAAAPPADVEGGRGRRERKPVEFLQVETKKEEEPVMLEGKGTKLRDIPNVAFKMSKISGKDELMESLHNVMFRRKGVATTRKKAILDFSGFAFVAGQEEKELEGRRASLGKWKLDTIHKAMDCLDLARGSGDKTAKIDRLMEFLAAPHVVSDVDLATKEAAKKEAAKRKREREAAKREKSKAKREKAAKKAKKEGEKKRKSADGGDKTAKKAKKEEEGSASGSEQEESSDDEPMSEPEASSESEEEVVPEKKERKEEKKKAPTPKAPKPDAAASGEKKKTEEEAPPADDPASKISPAQLKTDLEALLGKKTDQELTEMTAKIILNALKEQYGFEVRSRKAEVKELAQEYIEGRLGAAAPDA